MAAFLQAVAFVILSLILSQVIGLAGIPLSAALTFTIQAIVLLSIMTRRYPGLLQMGDTALRAVASTTIAFIVTLAVIEFYPYPWFQKRLPGL